jgi:hypothetical protein
MDVSLWSTAAEVALLLSLSLNVDHFSSLLDVGGFGIININSTGN